MAVIWKFPLPAFNYSESKFIPESFKPIAVDVQNGEPMLWAIVDTDSHYGCRRCVCVGTGEPFDDTGLDYLGTVQLNGLVWHYFMGKPNA